MRAPVFLTGWLRKSHPLTADEFDRLKAGAEVLEQDAHGIKVLRLPDGNILKLFRVKRLVSSAQLYSHARSFCRNADRLHSLGIPTVRIKQLYNLEGSTNTAVLYEPLPGRILRQIARGEGLSRELLQKYGTFVAHLHDQGVFFRSFHLGNVVVSDDGNLGLIDIADLSIRSWKLLCMERFRNFRHIFRLAEDRAYIGQEGWKIFSTAYLLAVKRNLSCWEKIDHHAQEWFKREGTLKRS